MVYSEDLRKKVIAYLQDGHTQGSAHEVFRVGLTTIKAWKKQYNRTGNLHRKPLNRSFKKLDPEKLSDYVRAHPDAYLREIAEAFGCTGEAVRQAMVKLKITRKKDEAIQGARRGNAEGVHRS
jgi:transposase